MGLSAISAFRRRLPSSKTTKRDSSFHLPFSRLVTTTKATAPQSPRKFRFKDLSPIQLVDTLAALDRVPSAEQARLVATHISSDQVLFEEFVSVAIQPPATTNCALPRDRFTRTWVVAGLLRHGPHILRETLSKTPNLIRTLASVFETEQGKLDPIQAAHVVDVLQVMLHEYPKQTAAALYSTKIVPNLVKHINLQPAASVLPRLVASRVFTSFQPAPVLSAHKRAVVLMGRADVQASLAETFCHAVNSFVEGKREEAMLIDACCNTMCEISSRAMSLQRKPEDFDERADMAYAGNLALVTSHMYNDAKDQLNLLQTVEPLSKVLCHALQNGRKEADVVLPVLKLIARLLTDLRTARVSLLPSMRMAVVGEVTSNIAQVLVDNVDGLSALLEEDRAVVGRIRLAVVDVLREACATLEEDSVFNVVCGQNCGMMRNVLRVVTKHCDNDILLVCVSQLLSAVFDRSDRATGELLRQTNVAQVVNELKTGTAMECAVSSLVACHSIDKVMKEEDSKLKRQLSLLEEYYEEQIKAGKQCGLVKSSGMTRAKVSADMAKGMDLESELGCNEDFGQEIYIHGLLDEIAKSGSETPPQDTVVRQAADAVKEGFSMKLKRLKLSPNSSAQRGGVR